MQQLLDSLDIRGRARMAALGRTLLSEILQGLSAGELMTWVEKRGGRLQLEPDVLSVVAEEYDRHGLPFLP